MARPRKDSVGPVVPLPNGSFEVYAKLAGKRIRERFRDRRKADARHLELQQQIQQPEDRTQALRLTWLSETQLRDAEAAVKRAGGRGLLECVEASDRVMVTSEPVLLATARTEWKADSIKRRREKPTIENNDDRSGAFIRWLGTKAATVQAVTAEHADAYIFRESYDGENKAADHTRVAHARVLRAWGRFWVKRKWVKVSPFEGLDVKDMKESAEAAELPRIVTPGQARALMAAALERWARERAAAANAEPVRDPRPAEDLAPYVALSTWCFLRHAEVLRVRADDLRLDGANPVVEVRPKKRGTPSYRTVDVPACVVPILREAKARAVAAHAKASAEAEKAGKPRPPAPAVAPFGRVRFDHLRAAAGLVTLGPVKNKKRAVISGVWQENILRHSGLSYLYQKTGNMREVTRQAGNSSDVAFRHYLRLPAEGDWVEFYRSFTATA